MNKLFIVSTVALAAVLAAGHAEGRGGGGRGGGGFHGGGGGGFGGGGGRSFGGGGGGEFRGGGGGFGGGGEFRGGGGGEFRGGGGAVNRSGSFSGGSHAQTFHPSTDFGNRPSYADRGNFNRDNVNRNNFNGNNVNRNNFNNNNINRNNFNNNNINRNNFTNNNFNRNNFNGNNWNHNGINHGDWYHGGWNNHWNHPWYNRPWGWYGAGLATGLVASTIPWSWGYYGGYDNPYYASTDGGYDYSQPILAQSAPQDQVVTSDQQGATDQPTATDKAGDLFATARQSFMQNNYPDALDKVNQAIALVPNDPSLHEFRGLVLFAMGKYKDAAGAIYAVLAAGPGWDWTTLSGLYPSVDVYTQQLRALEGYIKQHPQEADLRFLLAYQYLTDGATDAAINQFKQAVQLNPKDQLSAQLLASLTTDSEPEPAKTAAPKAPATPVTAASLAGTWTSTRPDGTSITLDLGKDAKYDWKLNKQNKNQDFNGTYTVADNLLVLNQNDSPAMVGQVTTNADRSFNFKLVGASPNDPGLVFKK